LNFGNLNFGNLNFGILLFDISDFDIRTQNPFAGADLADILVTIVWTSATVLIVAATKSTLKNDAAYLIGIHYFNTKGNYP
jgi:hypothetical protein